MWSSSLCLSTTLCLLLRTLLMSHSHSGESLPPLHGDYEAQRHWQEVTLNVELDKWYSFDLEYWGLDYPPLTAYHSLAMAKVAEQLNTSWVALNTSRGVESTSSKLYMRSTVLVADLLVLMPSILMLSNFEVEGLLLLGTYPGLILIDNGHFQYNNVSLGLFMLSLALLFRDKRLVASILFCLALNYKQMELYHALPIFSYLLGLTLKQSRPIIGLIKLSLVVVATFAVIWSPFIALGPSSVLQVIHRVFPLKRGVFEDKVASFWCSLNILIKIREILKVEQLVKVCLLTTLLAVLPSNVHLMLRPSHNNLLLALCNTAMAFFLFSYHVHEKSILLVSIPVAAYMVRRSGSRYSSLVCALFLFVSVLSMFPLLIKDRLVVPCLSLSSIFVYVCSRLGHFSPLYKRPKEKTKRVLPIELPSKMDILMQFLAFFIACVEVILCLAMFIRPKYSQTLPDLWPVLISGFSSLVFALAFVLGHLEQFCFHPDLATP